jgi:hypothetical protein
MSNNTEIMTLSTSGNIGIGTTSPSVPLEVNGSILINNTQSDLVISSTNSSGRMRFLPLNNINYIQSGLSGTSDSKADLYFTSIGGATTQMVLSSAGNIGINTTQPGASPYGAVTNALLTIRASGLENANSTILIGAGNGHYASITGFHQDSGRTFLDFGTCATAGNPIVKWRINGVGDFQQMTDSKVQFRASVGDAGDGRVNINDLSGTAISFYYSNTKVGSITLTGSSTAYNTSSDYRLKENVVPLTNALNRINQIPVHRFNFISEPNKIVDGFMAHEVQEVVPEAIDGVKDAVDEEGNIKAQSIDQSKLVPLLTAAIQELRDFLESKFPGDLDNFN